MERFPGGGKLAPVRPEPSHAERADAPRTRIDEPWLRALMLASSLQTSMTVAPFGTADYEHVRSLIEKPSSTVLMTFGNEPYPGMTDERFSGGAVVFLSTITFVHRTAALN
jgi:hypothetical protein